MRDGEKLVHRFRIDDGTEEIVVVDAVQQRRNVSCALLNRDRVQETGNIRVSRAGGARRNSLSCLRSIDEPIHTRTGERRINAGAVERDRIVGAKPAILLADDLHRLLDAFSVKLQSTRVTGVKASS